MLHKIINFFSTNAVKIAFTNNTLSDGKLFLYFYIILTYDAFGFLQEGLTLANRPLTAFDLVQLWGVFLISLIGLVIMFFANGGIQGKSLLPKFFAFSFTVGYKYAIAYTILIFLSPVFWANNVTFCEIGIFVSLNLMMLINIAFRIWQTTKG